MAETTPDGFPTDRLPRTELRKQLLRRRDEFIASNGFRAAERALAGHLRELLHALQPICLGVYWAVRGEFNALSVLQIPLRRHTTLALPASCRVPCEMHFRVWNGRPPTVVDAWGIPTADGPVVVPDVVLVPCVGYTRSGWRLGYGGGYFDRWLAAHPQATAVGVGWSVSEIGETTFAVEAHDVPLALVVTENGVLL